MGTPGAVYGGGMLGDLRSVRKAPGKHEDKRMLAAIDDAGPTDPAEKQCAQHHGSTWRGGESEAQRLYMRSDLKRPSLSIDHRSAAFAEMLLAMNGMCLSHHVDLGTLQVQHPLKSAMCERTRFCHLVPP